jgi:hypothetical protein
MTHERGRKLERGDLVLTTSVMSVMAIYHQPTRPQDALTIG